MSIERIQKIFELEQKYLKVGNDRLAPEAIQQAEAYLELKFPPSYRYYLEFVGRNTAIEVIENVVADKSGQLLPQNSSLIEKTMLARAYDYEPLPHQYILIENDMEYWHVMDTTQVNKFGNSPVISWWGDTYDQIYPDFDLFYLELFIGLYAYRLKKRTKNLAGEEDLPFYLMAIKEANEFLEDYLAAGFRFDEPHMNVQERITNALKFKFRHKKEGV